jgi:hypothetical protein
MRVCQSAGETFVGIGGEGAIFAEMLLADELELHHPAKPMRRVGAPEWGIEVGPDVEDRLWNIGDKDRLAAAQESGSQLRIVGEYGD